MTCLFIGHNLAHFSLIYIRNVILDFTIIVKGDDLFLFIFMKTQSLKGFKISVELYPRKSKEKFLLMSSLDSDFGLIGP